MHFVFLSGIFLLLILKIEMYYVYGMVDVFFSTMVLTRLSTIFLMG